MSIFYVIELPDNKTSVITPDTYTKALPLLQRQLNQARDEVARIEAELTATWRATRIVADSSTEALEIWVKGEN